MYPVKVLWKAWLFIAKGGRRIIPQFQSGDKYFLCKCELARAGAWTAWAAARFAKIKRGLLEERTVPSETKPSDGCRDMKRILRINGFQFRKRKVFGSLFLCQVTTTSGSRKLWVNFCSLCNLTQYGQKSALREKRVMK